ncbi:MAG: porin [Betaproteobacteria bacterium]|jgi:predicted porin|nr:porin [Betaproteobacteria bacterium]
MRKIFIASMMAAGGLSAYAQSSVTVYGIADTFVGFAKGAGTDTRLMDGGGLASQLGFRGVEDMGGGLKAKFTLEGGLNLDSGVGNVPGPGFMFTRQSFVGVSGGWGEVTLGRQYTPIFATVWRADPLGVNSVFSPVTLWGQNDAQPGLAAWAARSDNAVMYTSPTGMAVQGRIMYAPGEATNSSGNYVGANLTYESGPIWVGWGYQNKKSGTAAAPAANPTDSTSNVIAASYNAGSMILGASWGSQGSNVAASPKAKILNLNTKFIFGASSVYADYGRRDVDSSARDQSVWTLGYDYNLSKRTTLYARGLWLTNKGNGSVAMGGVVVTPNSGQNSRLMGVGITHRF